MNICIDYSQSFHRGKTSVSASTQICVYHYGAKSLKQSGEYAQYGGVQCISPIVTRNCTGSAGLFTFHKQQASSSHRRRVLWHRPSVVSEVEDNRSHAVSNRLSVADHDLERRHSVTVQPCVDAHAFSLRLRLLRAHGLTQRCRQ